MKIQQIPSTDTVQVAQLGSEIMTEISRIYDAGENFDAQIAKDLHTHFAQKAPAKAESILQIVELPALPLLVETVTRVPTILDINTQLKITADKILVDISTLEPEVANLSAEDLQQRNAEEAIRYSNLFTSSNPIQGLIVRFLRPNQGIPKVFSTYMESFLSLDNSQFQILTDDFLQELQASSAIPASRQVERHTNFVLQVVDSDQTQVIYGVGYQTRPTQRTFVSVESFLLFVHPSQVTNTIQAIQTRAEQLAVNELAQAADFAAWAAIPPALPSDLPLEEINQQLRLEDRRNIERLIDIERRELTKILSEIRSLKREIESITPQSLEQHIEQATEVTEKKSLHQQILQTIAAEQERLIYDAYSEEGPPKQEALVELEEQLATLRDELIEVIDEEHSARSAVAESITAIEHFDRHQRLITLDRERIDRESTIASYQALLNTL